MSTPGEKRGPCPYCRREIRWDFDHQYIEHALPQCSAFLSKTGDEFIQSVLDGQHRNG